MANDVVGGYVTGLCNYEGDSFRVVYGMEMTRSPSSDSDEFYLPAIKSLIFFNGVTRRDGNGEVSILSVGYKSREPCINFYGIRVVKLLALHHRISCTGISALLPKGSSKFFRLSSVVINI